MTFYISALEILMLTYLLTYLLKKLYFVHFWFRVTVWVHRLLLGN